MGRGSWSKEAFVGYCTTACSLDASAVESLRYTGELSSDYKFQDLYTAQTVSERLNPVGVTRECRDNEEHPNTKPAIIGLDVTGSMGDAATEVARKLNTILTRLYDDVQDVEFCVMGIGDVECDRHPLQVSQFESDIRIAEQLGEVYFEFGGGANPYESYSLAWYFALHHTDLDCWKRGERGLIITLGDEPLNPVLSASNLRKFVGDTPQEDVETDQLYKDVIEKYDVYHINVRHGKSSSWDARIENSWKLLGQNFITVGLDDVDDAIVNIVKQHAGVGSVTTPNEISW